MNNNNEPVKIEDLTIVEPPIQNIMRKDYEKYAEARRIVVNELKDRIEDILVSFHSSVAVSCRIKDFSSFYKKYLRLKNEDVEPVIRDLMGIRIICPFLEDIKAVENLIKNSFEIKEREIKSHHTFKEFGYESIHLSIKIPADIIEKKGNPGVDKAEIQIRTILQSAWAEVEHELFYKAEFNPFDELMKRKLAAVNASLSLADIIFQEIRGNQRKLSEELGKRRESFYQKIEQATDMLLFNEENFLKPDVPVYNTGIDLVSRDNVSIDELLVNALTAHNQSRFGEAIEQYSRILELKPKTAICSIIYKHRGMAYFACSQYIEAIDDFSKTLDLDDKSYKAAYYRGVVRSVIKEYSLAIDDFTMSLSINPYQSYCLFRRGQAYYHIGDYPRALSDCENSLALEPQNELAIKFKNLLHDKLRM